MTSSRSPGGGILKRGHLPENNTHFDMENLLTRSLYRVFHNTNRVPWHVSERPITAGGHNVDKMGIVPITRSSSSNFGRHNNHKIGGAPASDVQLQMRLLAQQICGRVERRYERRLEDIREKDRRETERKLSSIKEEYEQKYIMQTEKLEKERDRLVDQLKERERTVEHRLELRLSAKENELVASRRMVQNRAAELELSRENLERAKEEWHRRMESEMEQIKIERDKNAMNAVHMSARQKNELAIESELRLWRKRAQDLEREADVTRKKMADMMNERFRMRDEVAGIDHFKQEFLSSLEKIQDQREELAKCRQELRRTGDYDQLKEENEQLVIEIDKIRLQAARKAQEAVDEVAEEFARKEDRWKRSLNEAKVHAAMMIEKSRELETERDALKKELKTTQKMISKGGMFEKLTKRSQSKTHSARTVRKLDDVSDESTRSSLSEGDLEIMNIRQRIQNLDDIAKELDASIDHFSMMTNPGDTFHNRSNISQVELYDDFCRALHQKSVTEGTGRKNPKTSSPQKADHRHRHRREESDEDDSESERARNKQRKARFESRESREEEGPSTRKVDHSWTPTRTRTRARTESVEMRNRQLDENRGDEDRRRSKRVVSPPRYALNPKDHGGRATPEEKGAKLTSSGEESQSQASKIERAKPRRSSSEEDEELARTLKIVKARRNQAQHSLKDEEVAKNKTSSTDPTTESLTKKLVTPRKEQTENNSERKEEDRKREPVLSTFERRLQERGVSVAEQNERRQRMMQLLDDDSPKKVNEERPDSNRSKTSEPKNVENPMFDGVDPVMAEYMQRVMAGRKNVEQSTSQTTATNLLTSSVTTRAPEVNAISRRAQVEVTMGDEIELDDQGGRLEGPSGNQNYQNERKDDGDEWW